MLLTRSPLSPGPKARFSLDLHVLSAPPAFVLSQDQTLREEVFAGRSRQTFHFELVLKGRPTRGKREDDEVLMYLGQPKLLEVLDTRRTFTVEFSKTGAASDGVKKPPTRARGQPKLANRIGYESGRLAPVRVAGTFVRRPFGRPKEYSAPA
uniref:Uncharacterized protein n=1 Tax=uncultured bacterium 5G12 TaxID=1701325 RepID=A0A0N9HRB4_9BACT|nr:hypothetical protein 5G12_022 [uncultured bacterium 5G12]